MINDWVLIITIFLAGGAVASVFYLVLIFISYLSHKRELSRLEVILAGRDDVISTLQDRWMSQSFGEFKSWEKPPPEQPFLEPEPDKTIGIMDATIKPRSNE